MAIRQASLAGALADLTSAAAIILTGEQRGRVRSKTFVEERRLRVKDNRRLSPALPFKTSANLLECSSAQSRAPQLAAGYRLPALRSCSTW